MKKLISILTICIMLTFQAAAHNGKTDAQGGHYDYDNVSGLGTYHYHHGYEAHLHENGICPYEDTSEQEENHLFEPISEEDIDFSQFETLEEAYERGYFYGLYYEKSYLYEDETQSELENLLNLGIITNLYFLNSGIEYSESEDFTVEAAFEEGKIQASADIYNALSAYSASDFYTENAIYAAGAENEIDISDIRQSAYQKGYKEGLNKSEQQKDSTSDSYKTFVVICIIIAISFTIYALQQLFLKLYEVYDTPITKALMMISVILLFITVVPYIIVSIISKFHDWQDERAKRYAAEDLMQLKKHYEAYKNGEYIPKIWELEEFKKNGWE